jgi:hypothetical protein
MVPTGEIKPYLRNARRNSATVDKLVELIPKVGFNVPLVLDRSNVIVKGHSRWQAAQRLGIAAVPCIYTDADAETIKLDRLADNKVHEFSQWNEEMLASELAGLNLPFDYDIGTLGFNFIQPVFDVTAPPAFDPIGGEENAGAFRTAAADGPGVPMPGPPEKRQAPPFITAQDVARTVPLKTPEYIEIECDNCHNTVYVHK